MDLFHCLGEPHLIFLFLNSPPLQITISYTPTPVEIPCSTRDHTNQQNSRQATRLQTSSTYLVSSNNIFNSPPPSPTSDYRFPPYLVSPAQMFGSLNTCPAVWETSPKTSGQLKLWHRNICHPWGPLSTDSFSFVKSNPCGEKMNLGILLFSCLKILVVSSPCPNSKI